MASTKPDAGPVRKSILLLDQVPGSFADQVDEACSILDIDINESKPNEISEEQRLLTKDLGVTPREEFTLKWLLKRFQTDTETPSPCLEAKAWILLRRLVVRLPVFNIARRLKAEGFTKILLKTLRQLKEKLEDGSTPSKRKSGGESTAAEPEKSRKRKRDGSHVVLQQHLDKKTPDARLLFTSIVLAVTELQSLTAELPNKSRGYAIEHMKSALRALPEHSASIFGTFISIVTQIRSRSSGTPVPNDILKIEEYLPPMIAIWESRSITHIGSSSDLAFSRNCLVPILRLLASLQTLPGIQTSHQSTIDSLNRLLEKYIYVSAKIAFDFSKQRHPSERDQTSPPSVDELLAPLKDTVSHEVSQRPKLPGYSGEQLSPVALLFSIMLKHTPQNTPKQRTSQKYWLQFIFHQLIGCADIFATPKDSPAIFNERATILIQMLEESVKQRVRLEASELKRVFSFIANSSSRKGNSWIGWTLTSLCLQVNPTVLLGGYSKAPIERTDDNPLSSLLSDLNLQWKSSTEENYVYDTATFEVLLPLARAFGEARDLRGFIRHWKVNLLECQSKRTPPPEPYSVPFQSIWESENLLQCVASLLESRLTTGQINTILREIDGNLDASEDLRPLELQHVMSTDLVMLDCILSGCRSEGHISELSHQVKSIIIKLLALTASTYSSESKWRFWRVLATFNWRWNEPISIINPSMLQHNVDDAIQLIHLEKVSGYNHAEALFAVDFMLSVFGLILPLKKDQALPSADQHIWSAVKALVNLAGERIDSAYHGKLVQGSHGRQSPDDPCLPKWDFNSNIVASLDIFLLSCFALTLTNNLLCSLPADMQRQYFIQAFRWALWSKKQKQEAPTESITFPYIWQQLQRSITLAEDARFAERFREFQVTMYRSASDRISSENSDLEPDEYKLAFESIRCTPVSAFSRGHKCLLFNQILLSLCRLPWDNQELQSVIDHLNLLSDLLAFPQKSMNISAILTGMPKEDFQQDHGSVLVAIAANIDYNMTRLTQSYKGGKIHEVNEALRRLALLVHRYYSSTAQEAEGKRYFVSFYSELGRLKESQPQKTKGITFSNLMITCWGVLYQSGLATTLEKEEDPGLLYIIELDELGSWIEETLNPVSSDCGFSINDFRPTLRINLKNIRDFADIVGKIPSASNIYDHLSGIARRLSSLLDSKESRAVHANSGKDELLALVLEAMVRMRLPQDHDQLLELYTLARKIPFSKQKKLLGSCLLLSIVELDEDEKAKLLGKIEDSIRVGDINPSLSLILQTVVVVQSGSPTQREDIRLHLSHTFTYLCNCLFRPLPFQPTLLSMQTLSLMLQKLARSTIQWHIDNTMAVVTSAVAQSNSHTSPAQKGNIYLSACRLFSTILTLHRKRLGGRFHLVLLALQALLRCLFIPHTAFPPPDPDKTPHPYYTPHAAALSKLLSQVCSPAFSAVAKRRKDDRHLNDPVRKERDKVGRYMPIWLQTYCKCLLEGYLEHEEVQKEVERGVGIVIDCVPAEGLRVLNAGMDAEGRGVWRGVWAEWKWRNPGVKE